MNILKAPIITEKSMRMAATGWYTFEVDRFARKGEIAKAVEEQFKVNVTAVRTMITKGGSQTTGKKRVIVPVLPRKKAMVQLKKDQKIALFESSQTESK